MIVTEASRSLASKLAEKGPCHVITLTEGTYPRRILDVLREGAPPLLYCRGDVGLFEKPNVAIIGTRRPSALGRGAARHYARLVVAQGWVVVSGNAIGVDAAAHESALENGGTTVVFPPVPLDAYEPSFRAVAADSRVLVASRFVPGSSVTPWNFLARNELVAALCRGAIVAETGVRGGTLDTVGHLRRLHRPIFVVALPPEAKHYRAFLMLCASGATAIPAEPCETVVRSMIDQMYKQEKSSADRQRAADLFSQEEPQ